MEFILADKMGANDSVIERLRPYSLIVNAQDWQGQTRISPVIIAYSLLTALLGL